VVTGEGGHLGHMTQYAMMIEKQKANAPPYLGPVWLSRCSR
jgi:hypothetical protein